MISAGGVRETRAGRPRPVPTARDPRRRHARLDPRSDRRERRQRRPTDDRAVFLGEPRGGAVGADALPRDGGKPHPLPVSYTHLRAHETGRNLVCRLLLEKKKKKKKERKKKKKTNHKKKQQKKN